MRIYKCNWCNNIFWDKPRKYCKDECRKLARESKRKAKSSLTRGGHTLYEYRKFKKEVLKERGCICQKCGVEAKLIHHVKPVSEYPELELVKDNVIVICINCHILCHPELLVKFMKSSLYIMGK
jgi:5-methylcytosine-specific restriction endonuclease McrA